MTPTSRNDGRLIALFLALVFGVFVLAVASIVSAQDPRGDSGGDGGDSGGEGRCFWLGCGPQPTATPTPVPPTPAPTMVTDALHKGTARASVYLAAAGLRQLEDLSHS